MQQAVREITEMTERLEKSGLKREQGDAVIQAIANSIEKFAVTPEVLGNTIDRAFERADEIERQRFEAQDKRIQRMFDNHDKRFDGIDAKLSRITGWMVTLLVALVGTLAGVVARGMWL